jgi:transcription initiation factor TFIIIB Brf1 subunit/transcription initiation factor TFIIB
MCNSVKDSNSNSELPKQLIPRYVNKDVTVTYDIFFKNETFNLPLCSHERPFKEVKFTDDKIYKYGKDWKIEKYEYKTCPECGGELVAMDRSRGERVCECGMTNKRVMMIADTELIWQGSKDKLHTTKDSLTFEEKKVLKEIHKRAKQKGYKTAVGHIEANKKKKQGKDYKKEKVHVKTPMKDYRKSQYIIIMDNIGSQLFMTNPQKDKVKSIINKHSLRMFHNRIGYRTIIAGICRYVLMKESMSAGELRFNRSVFKFVGLTEPTYSIIKRNLEWLGL